VRAELLAIRRLLAQPS